MPVGSGQPFELVDETGDYRQALGPEGRIGGIEAKWGEQLAMAHRAARPQHFEIALREPLVCILVDRVERVYQAVAKRVGVHVKRGVDEIRDVGPVMAI